MHLKKILSIFVVAIFFISFINFNTVSAQEENNIVDADFNFEFISGTTLKLDVSLTAYKLFTDMSYNQEDIENAEERDIGAFEFLLYQELRSQLENIFTDASFTDFNAPSFNGKTFDESLDINLTSTYFGINETINSYDFINGILDMSAILEYNFNLLATNGWNNTFTFDLGDKLEYKRTNGNLISEKIQWIIKNWNGENPEILAELSVKDKDPTISGLKSDDIKIEFLLNSSYEKNVLNSNIIANAINIQEYNIIPSFITNLSYISADGIRLFTENNVTSWDTIYEKTIEPIKEKIETTIEKSNFNQKIDFKFTWDAKTTTETSNPYNINKMDKKPPVKALFEDKNVDLRIYNISMRGVLGLANSGANANISNEDINFENKIKEIGYPFNITLLLPDLIEINGKQTYTWNDTKPFEGKIYSNDPPTYQKEDKEKNIDIKIESTDLNLLSFLTGKTELNFWLDIEETNKYNVTTLPSEFNLPEKISLDLLNSDALRISIEENIFKEQQIDDFLKNGKKSFETRMKNILKKTEEIKGSTNEKIFQDSLKWDGNLENMDSKKPVKTSYTTHSNYPIESNLSLFPPGFKIPSQNFVFTGIKNKSVTYKMFFPEGLTVDVTDPYDKAIVKNNENGENYFEISFTPSESNLTVNVTCTVTPSILFIIGVFMPCFIALFIAILLIVIIILFRRRRKRSKPAIKKEETQQYEEDYYMPPPPGSK